MSAEHPDFLGRLRHRLGALARRHLSPWALRASRALRARFLGAAHPFVPDLHRDRGRRDQPRALLVYVTSGWLAPADAGARWGHTNAAEAVAMADVLGARGFRVDVGHVCDPTLPALVRGTAYDLVLGQGEPFREVAARLPRARRVIYLTESEPGFAVRREAERVAAFRARGGPEVTRRRAGAYIRPEHLEVADAAIVLGRSTLATYAAWGRPTFAIEPTGLRQPGFEPARDVARSRSEAVWFGSAGAILKGLDLALAALERLPGLHLHICGLDPAERPLFRIPAGRATDHGFVDVRGAPFAALMNRASFVVLPSCAEGVATSVLTCMCHGLIPVVTPETGVEVEGGLGFAIEGDRPEDVAAALERAQSLSDADLAVLHARVLARARERHSIDAFARRFDAALGQALGVAKLL